MKGFVAISLLALEKAQLFHGCLAVLLVCDEELGSFGAKHVLEHGLPVQFQSKLLLANQLRCKLFGCTKGT